MPTEESNYTPSRIIWSKKGVILDIGDYTAKGVTLALVYLSEVENSYCSNHKRWKQHPYGFVRQGKHLMLILQCHNNMYDTLEIQDVSANVHNFYMCNYLYENLSFTILHNSALVEFKI